MDSERPNPDVIAEFELTYHRLLTAYQNDPNSVEDAYVRSDKHLIALAALLESFIEIFPQVEEIIRYKRPRSLGRSFLLEQIKKKYGSREPSREAIRDAASEIFRMLEAEVNRLRDEDEYLRKNHPAIMEVLHRMGEIVTAEDWPSAV